MKGLKWMLAAGTAAGLLMAAGGAISMARAQDPGGAKQPYTPAEYNAYVACTQEKAAQARARCLEDFATKYPNPNLLIYAYPAAYQTYLELKNYPKVIETADKLLALGDKVDALVRYQAYYARAVAYTSWNSNDPAQAAKAREAALAGLKTLGELKKPDNIDDKTFEEEKRKLAIFFDGTAAVAARNMKDYPGAVESYKAVLALNPDDSLTPYYQMGLAYLAMNPPQQMDGFWSLARAASSKNATQQQAATVKDYLRKLLGNYQQAGCDNLIDAQLSELIQLAGSSVERPASYKIPSAADLEAGRKEMTIASVIADLKAGTDKGKTTWLSACGAEFPEVPSKVFEVVPGDVVTLRAAFVTNQEEYDAAKTPNMEVKVVGQPEASRIEKDNVVHVTGALMSYDPEPAFMLHWDKAKVNADEIPEEKKQPAKKAARPARRPPTKKPGA